MIKKFEEFVFESYKCESFEIRKRSDLFLLTESQESESQKSAIKLVMDRFGWDKERANNFVRVDLRNDITSLRDKQIGKFTLGVTRMYVDGELNDANTISDINATLKLLSAHLNEYDRNLNGLSADELISKFKKVRENNVESEKREISKMKFGVSEYEIIKIDSFSDAKKYYKYTNPSSRWCLTHMENMYDSYTCGGINQIYFCLKNGFKKVKPIVEDGAPLDYYGLSMLSIIVNGDGELAYCTCRWNHDNGGNDNVMDAVEISKVVNVDFYEIFKPNTKWKDMVDNAKIRLANGEFPEDIFDEVYDYREGYAGVVLNKKRNFINTNGELISDRWFDEVKPFEDGYAKVILNKKRNIINTNGELISDRWFDDVYEFKNGYCRVKLNDKWNFINTDGEYVFDKWFDSNSNFDKNGYCEVKLNNKWNFININGEYLFDSWFDASRNFDTNGYTEVKLNDKWNFIKTDGEVLSDKWFDDVRFFHGGYASVKLNNKWNFINTDGEYVFDKWFDDVYHIVNGYFRVELNDKVNFMNIDGELLSGTWFDKSFTFDENGYALVKLNNKWNIINTDGGLISDKWFDDMTEAESHINKLK
jgi:hypothetical protein